MLESNIDLRNHAMNMAYSYASAGNQVWMQIFIDRAGQFWPVHEMQLSHAQELLDKAKKEGKERKSK